MKLITDLKQNCLEPASVALGCFDGIHLGHQAVIGCAVADKPNGLTPSVFTFQENPLIQGTKYLKKLVWNKCLCLLSEKL